MVLSLFTPSSCPAKRNVPLPSMKVGAGVYFQHFYFRAMKNKKPIAVNIILEQLDREGYHLFLNVKLNGKKCRFLIDTGASHTVVDKGFFEKNFKKENLKTVKQSTASLHGSTEESHFGKIKELALGRLLIKNRVAAAIDLNHVNQTYRTIKKPKIHGIIGSDILVKYKMIIDYGQKKLCIPNQWAQPVPVLQQPGSFA